jgi:hypothetical protein
MSHHIAALEGIPIEYDDHISPRSHLKCDTPDLYHCEGGPAPQILRGVRPRRNYFAACA